jgi:ubiquinol-cytochrome c reductase cytochrome c1 subunit
MGGKHAHPHPRPWYWQLNDQFEIWRGMDWPSVRRGRQIYTEVFAPCHPLEKYTFNHFQQFMTREEIKKLAMQYQIVDTNPNEQGEYEPRPGKPTDWLPAPYPNSKAATFANNGAEPPPLRTAYFAMEGNGDYIFALLTGYAWGGDLFPVPPWVPERKPGQFWNPYFKGGVLSMPPPLSDGMIDFEDGTPATVSQMAKDVVNFLRWTAEPEYDDRRIAFWKTITTWAIFTGMFFHFCQKWSSWKNYQRVTFRYWKKTW